MANTETIYLGYHTEPITITLEAYTRIQDIIENNRACTKCGNIFETDNPSVSLNTCLSCYLARHSGLTFLGLLSEGQYNSTYGYLDQHGIVYTSYAGNDRQTERSDYYTLRHWGFTVPDLHTIRGEEKKLHPEYWHVYGDPVAHEAIVARYLTSYQGIDYTCVLYKDGTLNELNHRSKENKALFKRASELAESYKDDNGYYSIGDFSSTTLNEYAIYRLISEIVTSDYRTKQREDKEQRVNELVQQWLKGSVDDNALFEIIELYEELDQPRNAHRFKMLLEQEPEPKEVEQPS